MTEKTYRCESCTKIVSERQYRKYRLCSGCEYGRKNEIPNYMSPTPLQIKEESRKIRIEKGDYCEQER